MSTLRQIMAMLLAGMATLAQAGSGQLARGQGLYESRCQGCHSVEQHRTGPAHCGIFGRRSAAAPGYAEYSEAMRNAGIRWNEASLDRFLAHPGEAVPGTTMTYRGVKDGSERADLIAWMKQATAASRCTLKP